MGIVLCPAVAPLICCITWRKANKWACIGAALISLPLGIIAWVVTAYKLNDGVVDETTTGRKFLQNFSEVIAKTDFIENFPMLAGNTVSFGLSILISVVGSLIFPDNHDFESTKNTGKKAVKESAAQVVAVDQEISVDNHQIPQLDDSSEKSVKDEKSVSQATAELRDYDPHGASQGDLSEADIAYLTRSMKFATICSIVWVLVMVFIVTFSLYGTSYIFPRAGFKAWVSIGLGWLLIGAVYIIFSPIIESLPSLIKLIKGITLDVFTLGNYSKTKSSDEV